MYALIQNETFVRWVNLEIDYPHTSFPNVVTTKDLPDGIVVVELKPPPILPSPLHVVEREEFPVLNDGVWSFSYNVREMSEEEAEQATLLKAHEVRLERNRRISLSDWSQLTDATVDKAAWAAYRQALRDITTQPGFPFNIRWPDEPQT
jgi:hypothetical protein